MKIIIVGNGKVGFSLAEQLVLEQHDITIVDMNERSLRQAADILDVMVVKGNAVSADTLREAGAPEADLLVAATNADEVNMVCSLTAKNLGTKYTVARIRNPEYTANLDELRENLKIDMVINPESATAWDIARLLRFPMAANIETFCRGRVEMMGFRLQQGDFLVDKPLYTLSSQIKKLDLLFCAAQRSGEIIIPNGSFVPQTDDKLYVIGRPDSLDQFFRVLGRYSHKIQQVMVVGGGKITTYLADLLTKAGMRLKIVEQDELRCRQLSEHFPKATILQGDGTEQELLDSENLTACDAFVALTNRDEDNLIISLYAMQQGLTKVIAKCNRQNYVGIARTAGLDSVLSPKMITSSYILRMVRGLHNSQGSVMNALYRIADGKAEAMEFSVGLDTLHLGIPLKELPLRSGVLLAVIVRDRQIIIPEGSSTLQQGDSVIIISRNSGITNLNEIYQDGAPGSAGGVK